MTDLAALTGAVKARWIASRAMRRAEGEFAVTESAWCVFGARRDEYSSDQILLFVALGRLLGAFLPPERVSARGGGSLSSADLAPSYGQGGLSRRPNPRLPPGRVTPPA